nr:hypothetical protein [Treponema socranskii]
MTTITVPIKLTADDIHVLAEELNNCESSPLCRLIENILKSADKVSSDFQKIAEEIKSNNPYSIEKKGAVQ